MSHRLAIVLAAGKGTRMKSDLPKVLVPVCGRPMIDYVLDTLAEVGCDRTLVVVGYRGELVRRHLAARVGLLFVEQAQQLGTGHAVMACREHLAGHDGPVLIVTGDSPLVSRQSLATLLAEYERQPVGCLLGTGFKENPEGLGRIVRDGRGEFLAIVEQRDARAEQQQIKEVNLSCYVFRGPDLLFALERIQPKNEQRELYLTDCPGVLQAAGRGVRALPVLKPVESLSINTAEELAEVEAVLQAGGGP